MAADLILSNISRHISLDANESALFISMLTEQQISRKEFLLREGQVCRNISFVQSGILRAFHLDKAGREATIMFALEDWWITDMNCFINQLPAILNIQAVEDSRVFQLQKRDLDQLYESVPKFERFFRIIMQNAYIREQLRVIQNLSLPAEERYNNFIMKYPQVVQKVTQKQIAAYLGITPEFLSMIRKKKSLRSFS
jgi:CRP-like cAMP-binding protein